jgi:hypothetical protein
MALEDLRRSSLRFITGIRYHKDMLQRLNNITYIYDNNWNPNNTNKATFPVCFFHVKSYHEAMSSEVSQKQMLFYNSALENQGSDPALNSGLLNVVADNIVIKPKVYKLDVIIPYHNLTLLDQSFVFNTHTNQVVIESLLKASSTGKRVVNAFSNEATQMLNAWSTLSAPYVSFIKGLLRTLIAGNYTDGFDITDWLTNTVQQPDFNKQSLEIMWKCRHIVKMKMWNSWEYKYVAITDIDITKEGTEDGVYEASLTVQEMPIVTMYGYQSNRLQKVKFNRKNPLLDVNGKLAIELLDAVGGEGSVGNVLQDALKELNNANKLR